jgi:hypothetical protein
MIPGRVLRVAAGCVVLCVGWNLSVPTDARPHRAVPTVVDLHFPESLPLGSPPQAAYLAIPVPGSALPAVISRPGQTALPVGPGRLSNLMRVRGGFTVRAEFADHIVLRFVGDDGSRHRVVRFRFSNLQADDAVASGDGRLLALTQDPLRRGLTWVRIVRISDGETVARKAFRTGVFVSTFSRHRVLLTAPAFVSRKLTRWWNLDNGNVRLFDDGGRVPQPEGGLIPTSVGDKSSRRVAVFRRDHQRVATMPKQTATDWRTRSGEFVASWSPDDRYVLTMSNYNEREGTWFLNVRDASSGQTITTLTGNLGVDWLMGWSPVWESATTFIVKAGWACVEGCEESTDVRCTVSGVCEKVDRPQGYFKAVVRRHHPT